MPKIVFQAEQLRPGSEEVRLQAVQELLDKPQPLFALVLSPTRELAIQISGQFEALGATIGVKCAALVGGIDMMQQSIALGKRPHIIVGTPGRVVDHLSNTKVCIQTTAHPPALLDWDSPAYKYIYIMQSNLF
jgi:hypothetical protein